MKEKPIAVIDAETDPFSFGTEINPFIWGFYDGKHFEYYEKTHQLISRIKKFNGLIYAHNGGKFDYHFLLPYANRDQKIMVINGRLSKWKLGKATMLDSYNILPRPLSAMQKDVFDYEKMHVDNRRFYMDEIIKYLESDCVYLWRHVKEFIETYGLNLTLAGAAMKQWEKIEEQKRPKSHFEYYDFIKNFYYGGRVTPFKTGIFTGKNYTCYDINSAYPTVMKNLKHPISTKFYETKTPRDRQIKNSFFIVTCNSQGALPIRSKTGIEFPHGKYTFCCTGHELLAAIETKTISELKVEKAFVFEHMTSFDEYIDHFYAIKKKAKNDGEKSQELFAKLFLNSLYGRFAINPSEFAEYRIDEYGARIQPGEKCELCFGDVQIFSKPLPPERWQFLNVATSASITGAVRAFLWRSINKVHAPYYCDTDSIICESGDQLEQGPELGQWDIEGAGKKLVVCGKKLYCLHLDQKYWKGDDEKSRYKIASKGVRLNAQEIEKVAMGQTVTWQNFAPTYTIKDLGGKIGGHNCRYISRDIKMNEKMPIILDNDVSTIYKQYQDVRKPFIKRSKENDQKIDPNRN